jgi:hypothetical protein
MGVNEIEKWNSAYGLSKVLLRNLVVGGYMLLIAIILFQQHTVQLQAKQIQEINAARVSDIKNFNDKLQRKQDINDSLNRVFFENYYNVKTVTK